MGSVIKLDHYREPNLGNGAVPVVREYFDKRPGMPPLPENAKLNRGDHFLAWLWVQGFKVVPVTDGPGQSAATEK